MILSLELVVLLAAIALGARAGGVGMTDPRQLPT